MITATPIDHPAAWRGDELASSSEWIWYLSPDERAELEDVARRFVADDPDLRTATAAEYPLSVCRPLIDECVSQLDAGRGFILVRGLDPAALGDVVSGAAFYVMGLHIGVPMRQNQDGELLGHVIATSDKTLDDPDGVPTRIRGHLPFHSDSSDAVALMCLRGARSGGASRIVSGLTIYNEMLQRRPDLAALLFEPFHWDWRRQDHDAPAPTYTSPVCSYVDGVFSTYAGSTMVLSAQDHPGVPPLTADQCAALELYDEISQEPGLALDMDFQPGDVQWLLNYAVLHSRAAYDDWPEIERRRHLLRLWVRRDVGRPLVPGFGKNSVVQERTADDDNDAEQVTRIGLAVEPDLDWGM